MQWGPEEQAGFTTGTPWIRVNSNSDRINVKESLSDPDSIFSYYQKLIELRKEYDVISEGTYEPVFLKDKWMFAYKRSYRGERLLVLANFSGQFREAELDEKMDSWNLLLSNDENTKIDGKKVCLGPYGAVMLHQQGPESSSH